MRYEERLVLVMLRLASGHVIDGVYRVESVLSETDRASVYVVTHARYPEVPLVLKAAALARAADFERDTAALSAITAPTVARICDGGKLADGRPYRVMQRLAGPTLRDALSTSEFSDERATQIVVELAAVVHEANLNGLGPCDLSVDNLMFADGRAGRLCMIRALVPDAAGPNLAADRAALSGLRATLAGRSAHPDAHRPNASEWQPPASVAEIGAAMARTGGGRAPVSTNPGAKIGGWEVVRCVSETLQATVYEVRGREGQQVGALKLAGPRCDQGAFTKHADLLARVQSRHVVRVLDFGTHEGTAFMVMDLLHLPQSVRVERGAPLPIEAALQTVDELLWGAEAISNHGGAPSDFSLEHCYQATAEPSPSVLTHAMLQQHTFAVYGRPPTPEHADAWSAAVALYELIAGRLPFPTSKHSLAKAWMGMPIPLASRRRDVPPDISDLVHTILTGKRVRTVDLRRELTRIRSAPLTTRRSSIPPRASVPPRASAAPPTQTSIPPAPNLSTPPLPPPPPAPLAVGIPIPNVPVMPEIRDASELAPRRSIAPPVIDGGQGALAASLGGWNLERLPGRCPITAVAAAIGADGDEIVVVGRDAVARLRGGQWTVDPSRESTVDVTSLVATSDGGYVATTSTGAVLRLGSASAARAGFARWGASLDRFVFHAAVPDRDGLTLVGGTRDTNHGVVAKQVGESITVVTDALDVNAIRTATYLDDGTLLAGTEGGTVVQLLGAEIVAAIQPCTVDLHAVGVAGQDIVIVGAGAWAFRVTRQPLAAHLEPVETLSALTCLSVHGGSAWAGSSKGRILQRIDGQWRRMNRSFDGDPAVLAIHARSDRVRAVLADGHVVVGQLGA